ncbi:MAG: aspartate-semialdehyde dehydrogenase [Planctomycetota bacterium]
MKSRHRSAPRVGVLGATGLVGETLVRWLLARDEFEIAWLGASPEREGTSATEFFHVAEGRLPPFAPALPVPDEAELLTFVFSALPAAVAATIEPLWAEKTIVVSNASTHRLDPLVPLVVPEINADHMAPLLGRQREERGWRGLVTNPNCIVVPLVMALAPWRDLGLEAACVTTYQALSGAGRHGPSAFEATGNVIPEIPGESAKVESEPLRILGRPERPLEGFTISSATARVPVPNGHLLHVRVKLREPAVRGGLLARWEQMTGLTTTPACPAPLEVMARPPRPSDLERFDLVVRVGGLRPDPVLGWQFWTLADNLARGAAGAAWLNALAIQQRLGRAR